MERRFVLHALDLFINGINSAKLCTGENVDREKVDLCLNVLCLQAKG